MRALLGVWFEYETSGDGLVLKRVQYEPNRLTAERVGNSLVLEISSLVVEIDVEEFASSYNVLYRRLRAFEKISQGRIKGILKLQKGCVQTLFKDVLLVGVDSVNFTSYGYKLFDFLQGSDNENLPKWVLLLDALMVSEDDSDYAKELNQELTVACDVMIGDCTTGFDVLQPDVLEDMLILTPARAFEVLAHYITQRTAYDGKEGERRKQDELGIPLNKQAIFKGHWDYINNFKKLEQEYEAWSGDLKNSLDMEKVILERLQFLTLKKMLPELSAFGGKGSIKVGKELFADQLSYIQMDILLNEVIKLGAKEYVEFRNKVLYQIVKSINVTFDFSNSSEYTTASTIIDISKIGTLHTMIGEATQIAYKIEKVAEDSFTTQNICNGDKLLSWQSSVGGYYVGAVEKLPILKTKTTTEVNLEIIQCGVKVETIELVLERINEWVNLKKEWNTQGIVVEPHKHLLGVAEQIWQGENDDSNYAEIRKAIYLILIELEYMKLSKPYYMKLSGKRKGGTISFEEYLKKGAEEKMKDLVVTACLCQAVTKVRNLLEGESLFVEKCVENGDCCRSITKKLLVTTIGLFELEVRDRIILSEIPKQISKSENDEVLLSDISDVVWTLKKRYQEKGVSYEIGRFKGHTKAQLIEEREEIDAFFKEVGIKNLLPKLCKAEIVGGKLKVQVPSVERFLVYIIKELENIEVIDRWRNQLQYQVVSPKYIGDKSRYVGEVDWEAWV